MRRRPRSLRLLAPMVGLVLVGCTAAATPTPTRAPTAAPTGTAAATTAASASPLPGTKQFKFGFIFPGLSSVGLYAAIDDLNAAGYTIEKVVMTNTSLMVEGNVANQVQMSAGTAGGYLVAAQKNGPIRIVSNRNNNDQTNTAKIEIKECKDLQGKVMGNAGEGTTGTIMSQNWIRVTCPGTTMTEVNINGSDNRAIALQNGQIDATQLELANVIPLLSGADASKFHVLVHFAKSFPNLKPSLIAAHSEWAAQNPGSVVALIKAMLLQNRKINADPTGGYLKSLALKYFKDSTNANTIDAVAKAYVEQALFPNDGGFTAADVEFTAKFFLDAKVLPAAVTVQQASDLTFHQRALKDLGS
jgi:ABC-type nitrate/sulfonate/bicarbonate transport system substrate-binding protein